MFVLSISLSFYFLDVFFRCFLQSASALLSLLRHCFGARSETIIVTLKVRNVYKQHIYRVRFELGINDYRFRSGEKAEKSIEGVEA